jgi:hypothetical protein
MSFDKTKTIQIKLKITLKEAFVIKGSLAECFNLTKIVLQKTFFYNLCGAIEARAILFSKLVWDQFNLQVKTAI